MAPKDRPQAQTDIWTPEPELREMPPRNFEASPHPDLNAPNIILFLGLGLVLLAVGLILFVVGLSHKPTPKGAFVGLGLLLALVGAALVVYFPIRRRSYFQRAENLIKNGMPVISRILSSENTTGDSQYGRFVKYQVTLPGGEVAHRETKVDDRALPPRIPCDATALVDMQSGDAELYCALPYRAIVSHVPYTTSTPAPTFGSPVPTTTPTFAATATAPDTSPRPAQTPTGTMGTMGTIGTPVAATPQPTQPVEPAPAPETPSTEKPATKKNPWE